MKKIILLFLLIISASCKNETKKIEKEIKITSNSQEKNKVYPFFNFDEVEHYKIIKRYELECDSIMRKDSKKRTKREQDLVYLFALNYPKKISENDIIIQVPKFYYKTNINEADYKTINDIYSEKYFGDFGLSGCAPFYRDILIFKKNNIIIGFSKICFQCQVHYTIGTKRNTIQLGQNGDYSKLEKLLRK